MNAKVLLLLVLAPYIAVAVVPIAVSVDLNANVHPFSPMIFGVALLHDFNTNTSSCNLQAGYTVCRWGGNSTTRYNWEVDVHNTANDYYYENIPDCTAPTCTGTPPIGNSADTFISGAFTGSAQPLLTIPTIGWTPRSDSPRSHPYFAGFSVTRYGVQEPTPYGSPAVDPFDTDAGSGECLPANNPSPKCVLYDAANGRYHLVNNDPLDTSMLSTPSFEAQWIAHLQSTFGTAANGGVKLYALDNEIMLWNSTHRDVRPQTQPLTYDDAWTKTHDYATAIKTQEPDALVTGPVTWGYCDLFGSAADNCLDGTDRAAHSGLPFVAWYLQQVCANPLAGGAHLVDYLDLHYYPQGNNVALSNADDATTAGLRLRSLKELYDPTWRSESWIGGVDGPGGDDPLHYPMPNLIPRVRAWINQYCPGTKLAITEYNWGNDGTTSGAVAQAEALAIFAREGVNLATRWVAPAANSLAERSFQIFLNYDGAGSKVRGDSVSATSASVDQIGAYAFRQYGQRSMILLTNKDTVTHAVALTFNAAQNGMWKLYGFTGASPLAQTGSGTINSANLTLPALPAMSANLLVLADSDGIFKDGFEPRP